MPISYTVNAIPLDILREKWRWYWRHWGNDLILFKGHDLGENANSDGQVVIPTEIVDFFGFDEIKEKGKKIIEKHTKK